MSPGRLHTFTSILISLVWSQARAFPMLVNLAARSTLLSSRPTISRIAQHRSYRRSSQSGPQTGARERQRHSFVNRAALSSTMSTMSSSAAAVVQESAEDPQRSARPVQICLRSPRVLFVSLFNPQVIRGTAGCSAC